VCGVGVGVRRGLRGASVPRWSASPRGAARGTRSGRVRRRASGTGDAVNG